MTVIFKPDEIEATFKKGDCLLDVAKRHKVSVFASCGGNGTCGTCLMKVIKGLESVEPRGYLEREMAADREWLDEERLACQIEAKDGLILEVRFPNKD